MASALHDLMRRFAIYTEGEQVVMDLETQLAQFLAGESVDALRLRRLLYEMVGALSPPRMKSSPMENTVPLDNLAAERLKETALIQRRVREVLIKALSLWRKTLKLEDLQIEPILGHLQQTIEHFERRHLDVQHARAGGQWQRLKAAIGLPQAQAEPSSSPSSDPKLAAALGEDGATSARGPASDRAASHLQFVRGVAETGSAEEVFEGQGVGRGPPLLAAAEGSAQVAQPQAWERAQIPGSGEAPPRQQNKKAVVKRTPAKDKSDTPYKTQYYRRDHKIGLRKMCGDKKQVFQFGVPSSIEEQLKKLDDAARNMLECGFDLKSVKDAVHQAVAKIKADKKAGVKRTPAKDESVSEATTRGCGSQDVDRQLYRKRLPKESQAKVVSEKWQPNSWIQNLPHVELPLSGVCEPPSLAGKARPANGIWDMALSPPWPSAAMDVA